ncbi:putative ABC transport system permease protein [Silvibacterium bohemicum]|uniref:Putative ABC transport system permease protein n=1 Tax=Silvibacterium bohemicum TaxID=1577686 RepID=A0A841JVP1_9BACT|nr:ABC transporter permease [Silvibacterium bohemicum]MBB6145416.1 putative ABC transport system permease protein [Silvibacterium bohemicum]
MEFKEAIKIALQSLWANKLRSVLTLIGVVIGVSSVIAVITLTNGVNKYVATKVYGYGADVFTLSKESPVIFSYEQWQKFQRRKKLKLDDYKAIDELCKSCESVGALLSTSGKIVFQNHSSDNTNIRGWTWNMPAISNLNVVLGRSFVPADDQYGTRVAIIGYDIVDNLMPNGDPLGKEIRVDGEPYTVIGVGERQGKTLGQSQDNYVAVPISAYQHTYGTNDSVTIYVKAGSVGPQLERASDEARVLLRSRRHDAPGTEDSFELSTNETFVGLWKSISSTFLFVVIGIASISLVVGGIVIMNIMLVSVTERTREIGVRKALGAKYKDILLQFLIESGTMSLLGGFVGVLVGAGVAKLVTALVGFPSDIALWSVLMALFVSAGIGVFFGVYPARRAAMLDPIVALRSEL